MAWLKVSFPAVSKDADALVPVGPARLAASGLLEGGPPVFFTEAFFAFGFLIDPSDDISRPNGARHRSALAQGKWPFGTCAKAAVRHCVVHCPA
jgi:hypothetical protein